MTTAMHQLSAAQPISNHGAGQRAGMSTRKRRLSSASLSSSSSGARQTVSPSGLSTSDLLGASTTEAEVDADGDLELGESDVSLDGPVRRSVRVGDGLPQHGHASHTHANPHDSGHRLKRRRKTRHDGPDSAVPVSQSFEGMILDEAGQAYTVQSPTSPPQMRAQAFPFPVESSESLRAEPMDEQQVDGDGDVTLMEEDALVDDFERPEVVEPAGRAQQMHNGRPRGKGWYEPEKDRIVVTSLSDSDTSQPSSPHAHTRRFSRSRDRPPDGGPSIIDLSAGDQDGIIDLPPVSDRDGDVAADPDLTSAADLAQPGPNGFTVSPSLLARLTRAQLFAPKPHRPSTASSTDQSRSLIMYRPMRSAPAEWRTTWNLGAASAWDEDVDLDADDEAERDAAGRIEEIDEDEDGYAGGKVDDVDMEVDEGLVENVDSMDIG